ncbi:MAG: PqqD family protein [Armatimonadetes bacterium]|nr:PqqD family protein [Armatimonadota bacterium]
MKGLIGKAWDYLPISKGSKKPTREQLLSARPTRNENLRWFKEDGEVNLFIPRRKGRFGDLAGRLFRLPDEKQLVLDRVGSGVWELCDGVHNVKDILLYVQQRHKLSRREAEVSVSTYLKILAERALIGIRAAESKKANERSQKTRKTGSPTV